MQQGNMATINGVLPISIKQEQMENCYAAMYPEEPLQRTAKRREQSRSAAKCRRVFETEVFSDLAAVLPTAEHRQTVYQSDRIGVLRLALTVCRARRIANRFFSGSPWSSSNPKPYGPSHAKDGDFMNEQSVDCCLDGFIMLVNRSGQMVYVTPNISESAGFTQIDLVGKYLRDYVHADDWRQLCEQLKAVDTVEGENRKTFFRIKTALTPRGGRARKLTMAVYQAIQGYVIKMDQTAGASERACENAGAVSNDDDIRLIYCVPFALSSSYRSSHTTQSMSTRHEMDMRFKYCDEKLATALRHRNAKSFVGQSFFDYVHPEDLQSVSQAFKEMYRKGHCNTGYYRLMTNHGDCVWTTTEAAVLAQNIRGVSQKSIVCSHQFLSGVERMSLTKCDFLPKSNVTVQSQPAPVQPQIPSVIRVANSANIVSIKAEPEFCMDVDENRDNELFDSLISPDAANRFLCKNFGRISTDEDFKDDNKPVFEQYRLAPSMNMAAACDLTPNSPSIPLEMDDFVRSLIDVHDVSSADYQPNGDFWKFSDCQNVAVVNARRASMAAKRNHNGELVSALPMPNKRLDKKSIESFESCMRMSPPIDLSTGSDVKGKRRRLDVKSVEEAEIALIESALAQDADLYLLN